MLYGNLLNPNANVLQAASIVTHIRTEIDLHIEECKQFGLSRDDLEQCEESQGTPL